MRCRPPELIGSERSGQPETGGARRGPVVRNLIGRTVGHATVRGTRWLTLDRCDGTLTRVTEGAVAVRDRRRGRTVLVEAGRSYLARRRR